MTVYKGRFAPSPTGALHQGSLTAALGSYLDARSNGGEWHLRIDDIDPPREDPEAKTTIQSQLETHAFFWDGEVIYQSLRSSLYLEQIKLLSCSGDFYLCRCSRKSIKEVGCSCSSFPLKSFRLPQQDEALKLKPGPDFSWEDLVQGPLIFSSEELGNFIIIRKGGLFSYQITSAIDDVLQGMTHVFRGKDLIDSTACQGTILKRLGYPIPQYAHLPLVINEQGDKLSKQRQAPIITACTPSWNLFQALRKLGQNPPEELKSHTPEEIVFWGTQNWDIQQVPVS